MAFDAFDGVHVRDTVDDSAKILVVGPFGVGKTTLIRSVSEIEPLSTEERMTQAGAAVDSLAGIGDKTTTTVALDFGRLTLSEDLALYLFGTPGQQRFATLWDYLAVGALGALVLADSRRLDACFETLSLVERRGLTYAVALNRFPDTRNHPDEEIRDALDLLPDTPLVTCDARQRDSVRDALIALMTHLRTRLESS